MRRRLLPPLLTVLAFLAIRQATPAALEEPRPEPKVAPPVVGSARSKRPPAAIHERKLERSLRAIREHDRLRDRLKDRRARKARRHRRWEAKKRRHEKSLVHRILVAAKSKLGTPYAFGAGGPWAFDCSGFTRWLYAKFGIQLPHSARLQFYAVPKVRDIRPGDLLFFSYGRLGSGVVDHVEVALTERTTIGTSNSTEDLDIDPIDWSALVGIGRPL